MVIPGLPDDIALQCLIRVPKFCLVNLRCVCKTWNEILSSQEYYLLRRRLALVDEWLFLVMSSSSGSNRSIRLLKYDFQSTACHRIKVPLEAEKHLELMGVGCVSSGHRFFVLGGSSMSSDGLEFQQHSELTIFDAITGSWTTGASMKLARSYFASGVIDGILYAAGGCENERTAEAYDCHSGTWSTVATMPIGFNHIESFAVFQRKLYVKGLAGRNRRVLVFDPSSRNPWTVENELEKDLREGEFVATEKKLYVINQAGYIGRYDEEFGWQQVGIVSCWFLPFVGPSLSMPSADLTSSSSSVMAMVFRNDAIFVKSKAGIDLSDLTRSKQVHVAFLNTFWRCQSSLLRF